MQHDVIVVGAGPGGATAAYELARRGLRVALFEQKALPRYKPCGGCLSLKIDRILDLDFRAVVERTVAGATFTFEGLDAFHVRSERPVAYMVMRDRFDHFLALQARQAGAEVHEGVRVLDVTESAEGVHVTTDRGAHEAQYLVGADGANGIVARAVGLAPRRRVAVCVEAEVATARAASVTPRDEVRIEFGAIPFGYGWVFRKGDHLSIGVGGLRDKIGNPRALYDEFRVDQDLSPRPTHGEPVLQRVQGAGETRQGDRSRPGPADHHGHAVGGGPRGHAAQGQDRGAEALRQGDAPVHHGAGG